MRPERLAERQPGRLLLLRARDRVELGEVPGGSAENVCRPQDQRPFRSQGALETVDDAVDRLAVEVDEHVPADDQVERRLAQRRHGPRHEVVLREVNDAPDPFAGDECVLVVLEVQLPEARRDRAQRALAVAAGPRRRRALRSRRRWPGFARAAWRARTPRTRAARACTPPRRSRRRRTRPGSPAIPRPARAPAASASRSCRAACGRGETTSP